MLTRTIPSTGESLPVIGIGTWQTFDTAKSQDNAGLQDVLKAMHGAGGRLIDTSPMYGRAEEVIGEVTTELPFANDFFYATKVWTTGLSEGILQMEGSMQKLNRRTMDLIQVHNMLDWQTHFSTLRRWKETGKVRYIGITHYRDDSHVELEKIMRSEKPDFVQFNYSIHARHAEKRLLPAAAELGIATLINRPLGQGRLMEKVNGQPLPDWATERGIHSWGAYFLKFILAHPVVTCVIPATSKPEHIAGNLLAGNGDLPDQELREKMAEYFNSL